MSKKDYGNAIQEWELAVRQNPSSSTEHRMLGEALVLDEQLEEGVESYVWRLP